jgi:hypothetical protein
MALPVVSLLLTCGLEETLYNLLIFFHPLLLLRCHDFSFGLFKELHQRSLCRTDKCAAAAGDAL